MATNPMSAYVNAWNSMVNTTRGHMMAAAKDQQNAMVDAWFEAFTPPWLLPIEAKKSGSRRSSSSRRRRRR